MRNRILFIIFLLLFSNPFSVSADVQIKVGIYQNKPKIFTDNDGKVKGFYIDLLEYIASKEGWRLEYVPGTWDQCLERLENGRIDLLPDIAFSEERAKRFDFNQKTVLSNWAVVFTRKDAEIESFADLNGKKIAFMKGDITLEQFKSQIKPFGIDFSVVESDDYKGVFKLLHEKKADAGLVNHLFGLRHEKQYNIRKSPMICCPRELRFAVPKNKNPHLIEAVDRHLITLKKDNRSIYYRAQTQWIEKVPLLKLPGWVLNILLSVSGLLILLFAIAAVSRFQVKARTAELSIINKELRQEIENRKQVEKKLRVSEEKFLKAFHSSPDAITLTTMEDGRFVEINDRGLRLTGYDRNEVIGLTTVELNLWADPADRERFTELLRKESLVLDMEANFRTKAGEIRTGLISGEIFYLQNNPHLISIIRDITDRKQAEAKIQQRSKELESLNAILSAVITKPDLQSILDQSLQSALDLTGLEGGTLCLADREKGGLTLASARNASSEMIRSLSEGAIKIEDCLCGDAAQTMKPLILWDNASESKYATLEAIRNEGIRFHAAFPLIIKGRAIGVLCIFARSETKPSEQSLKLVQGICGPIALAIENAQLYDEAKQHAATLEKRVDERTAELRRMVNLMAGRELRMAELKEEIQQLKMDR
jgi:PAS domain S-box-containing protein